MNRGPLVGALVVAAVVVGGLVFLTSRRSPPAPPERAVAAVAPRSAAPREPSPGPASPRAAGRPAASAPAAGDVPSSAAEPELGTLRIEADVPGAQVFIDRRFVGTAPLTAERITPGTHQLNVTAEGFEGIAQSIDVEPGPRDLNVRLRNVRLNATLAVVHRHRIGSCRGQLIATVEGIRYDADNQDDAFSVGLQNLEVFQVDYQEKNLRIKVRKGKQYTFTDPDGNADRLFVFHRDVENARARLEGRR